MNEEEQDKPERDALQEFFSFMSSEHGLILTQTELFDILSEAEKCINKMNKK